MAGADLFFSTTSRFLFFFFYALLISRYRTATGFFGYTYWDKDGFYPSGWMLRLIPCFSLILSLEKFPADLGLAVIACGWEVLLMTIMIPLLCFTSHEARWVVAVPDLKQQGAVGVVMTAWILIL